MDRMHDAAVRSYWTSRGKGVKPKRKYDRVCGTVVVSFPTGGSKFKVQCSAKTSTYDLHPDTVPPGAPTNLTTTVNGNDVTLNWSAPTTGDAVESYRVEVGTSPGASNTKRANVTGTSYSITSLADRTYYARVRADNAGGSSPYSSNTRFEIDASVTAPGTPSNLTANVDGSTVTLRWNAPITGGTPSSYAVEVGTSPGASDYRTATVPGISYTMSSVPDGAYYARVKAKNVGGTSAATADKSFEMLTGGGIPNMSMTIDIGGSPEVVTIRNDLGAAVNMTGWSITSDPGNEKFDFPNGYTLGTGGTVRVTSGSGAMHNPPGTLRWSGRFIWNNDGDRGRLFDAQNRLVAQFYGTG